MFHFIFTWQYLKKVKKLPGYGEIAFPYCKCDARKDGMVIVSVGIKSLNLHACDPHGVLEVSFFFFQVQSFQWHLVHVDWLVRFTCTGWLAEKKAAKNADKRGVGSNAVLWKQNDDCAIVL